MAKRIFSTENVSYAAVATGSIVTVASSYMGMNGSSATQITDIDEVLISGMSSASTLGAFRLAPIGTAGATFTALAAPNGDGPMQSNATPVINITYITATTQPTNSASITAPRINLGLNTFGGIIRWNAAPTQQMTMTGNTALSAGAFGQVMLYNDSSVGVTAVANAHIIYEPY